MPHPIVLADAGRMNVGIVTRRNPSAVEEYAAEELRRHLCQMAGAGTGRMPWPPPHRPRIVLNDPDAARAAGVRAPAIAPEGFHIESRGRDLFILGDTATGRGLLYGVYELLESLGCRWFASDVSVIPHLRRIQLAPIRLTAKPAFEFRDHFSFEAWDPLWSVRNRFNGNFTSAPSYMGGHNSYGLFVHTFYALLPPEEFFEQHPEYFSLVDGVRRRQTAQLCLTNPEVLRIVTQRVLERMRANPQAKIFSVSQNDFQNYCTCPQCSAVAREEGSQSGPILRFVNAIAQETSKVFPDKLIDTLAYEYSLKAPRLVRPGPNVRVRLCSIRCCQGHGYGDCDHPGSVEFLEALRDWSKVTSQMYIWHYCTNFAHYHAPMADLDELHANINLYRRHGVHGLFMQGCGEEDGGAESAALRAYIVGRLLWNPDRPLWPMVDEFLAAYYGPAAKHVRRYLDIFHGRVRRNRKLHPSLYDSPHHPLFSDDALKAAGKALREGEKRSEGIQQQRVRMLRHGIDYLQLYRAAGQFRRIGNTYRGQAKPADRELCEQVVRDWRASSITAIQENAAFEFSVQRMRNRLKPHHIHWLDDGKQRIAVLPGMGGRLLEWHAFGHQWLSQPQAQGPWWQVYPLHDGYEESAYLAVYARIGWAESYRCTGGGSDLLLVADLDHHLRFERRFTLRRGTLRIHSRLSNLGDSPRRAGWSAALRLVLPGPADVHVTTATGIDHYPWANLGGGDGHPLVLEAARLPARGWRAELDGFTLEHTARIPGPCRATFSRQMESRKLAFDLRTDERPLAPGQAISVKQSLKLRPTSCRMLTSTSA